MKLAVDNRTASFLHCTGQVDEGQLRGTGHEREHAFAEEGAPDVDTVEAADQPLVLPHLDAGGEALAVELGVGGNHVGAEPGTVLLDAQPAAVADDAPEVLVDAQAVLALVHQRAHGVADVNLVGEDDEALHGTVPDGVVAAEGVPWEYAVAVGQQQAVDAQVSTHGYQPVFFTKMGIGKPQSFIELYHHKMYKGTKNFLK